MKNILTVFLLFCFWATQAQITVKEDYPIESMMDKYAELNKSETSISGWRIQLIATIDRQKVDKELQKFRALYPDIPADWTHSKPYYKLRCGAYRTRLDAIRAQKMLKDDYPRAYPAKDKIKKSELL